MFINGIVASKSTHTREVAKKAPGKTKVISKEIRLSRWFKNKQVSHEWHMLPFVEDLLAHLSSQTLVIAIDGSEVGRNCVTLMVSLIYQKRAIPLLWLVRSGSKGHFAAELHIELLKELQELLPEDTSPVLLGDGAFDSVELQTFVSDAGWEYVWGAIPNLRSGSN